MATQQEPTRKALEEIGRGRLNGARPFRELDHWRDGLLDGRDELVEEILSLFPDADRQRLSQLVPKARK